MPIWDVWLSCVGEVAERAKRTELAMTRPLKTTVDSTGWVWAGTEENLMFGEVVRCLSSDSSAGTMTGGHRPTMCRELDTNARYLGPEPRGLWIPQKASYQYPCFMG